MITAAMQEIVLAGLLHDIGKFAQRAGKSEYKQKGMEGMLCRLTPKGYYSHQHVLYTMGYLESVKDCFPDTIHVQRMINLAAYHHNPAEDEHHIITIADRLSSGMDRRTDKELEYEILGKFYEQPMLNIASTLRIKENDFSESEKNETAYLPIAPFDGKTLVRAGGSKLSKQDYERQWVLFEKDFLKLKGLCFDNFISSLLTLLERYTWCIPSSTVDDPDISLFHHAKTTAAFAACIHQYAESKTDWRDLVEKEVPYVFLQGDMSGIQKYIFDLPVPKYNAKLLRARSFQVWALSLAFARHLVARFNVSEANIITFAGGRFLLLLPNSQSYEAIVEAIQTELDSYMLKEFSARLSCIVSSTPIKNPSDLIQTNGVQLQFRMQNHDALQKMKKFQHGLHAYGHVLEQNYIALQKYGSCPLCEVNPATESSGHCKSCDDMLGIGSSLMKAKRILLKADTLQPFGKMVRIVSGEFNGYGYTNRVYEPGLPMISLPYLAPFRGDEESGLLTFEEIAQDLGTRASKKLAMFKADIDNLGLLFGSSLGDRWSLSRYADLSYQFQQFFSAFLAQMIAENETYQKSIYVVFSGGDDLCILGPWDVVMEFALDFRKQLDKFTNNNKAVTLSGGIVLASSTLPVRNLAAMAEETLDASKHRAERGVTVKDGITVFGVTQSWPDYAQAIEDGKQMLQYIRKKAVTKAAVYQIIDFSHRAERVGSGNLRDLLWASNYTYQINRNIKGNETKLWFARFAASPAAMIKARVSSSYALYQVRDRNM